MQQFTQTFQIGDYYPALVEEQSGKVKDQLAVVDGENFLWNLRGVQSGYGVLAGPRPFAVPPGRHPAQMLVRNKRVFCLAGGLYRFDGAAFVPHIVQTASMGHSVYDLQQYKWSYAYVGTRHWFCHPTFPSLFYYDEFDDEWGLFRDPCWDGPVFSICEADNSLIVLLQDVLVWSKFDEGDKWERKVYCDTGAQSTALMKYGQPFAVMPYNKAWLTFTSTGILLSSPTTDQAQHPDMRSIIVGPARFNHRVVTTEQLAYGPAAIVHQDGKAVYWLAEQGFRQFTPTSGGGFGAVQPVAAEMGRFYFETLIPQENRQAFTTLDAFALEWLPRAQALFVSSGHNGADYTRAHVWQIELDKWGAYNYPHSGLADWHEDVEITLQKREFGHVAALRTAGLVHHDHQSPRGSSWIKLSPVRLQVPQELPARTVTSVQEVRLGTKEPPWVAAGFAGLQSPWRMKRTDEVHPTQARVLLHGGDGAVEVTGDEIEYLTPFRRTSTVSHYTCHVTGVALTLYVIALANDEHFDIRHVEMTYFYAGVL